MQSVNIKVYKCNVRCLQISGRAMELEWNLISVKFHFDNFHSSIVANYFEKHNEEALELLIDATEYHEASAQCHLSLKAHFRPNYTPMHSITVLLFMTSDFYHDIVLSCNVASHAHSKFQLPYTTSIIECHKLQFLKRLNCTPMATCC